MDVNALQKALTQGDWGRAEAMLSPLAQAPDAHVSILYNYGKVLLELDRFGDASAALARAVETTPDHANAWFELGRASLADDDFENAFEAFSTAARLMPDDPDCWRNLGRVALRLGKYETAQAAWQRFPGDPEAALALYRVAAETRAAEASEMRQALLQHHPDRAQVIKTLVRVARGSIPLDL